MSELAPPAPPLVLGADHPEFTVILLHGLTSSAEQFAPIASHLNAALSPRRWRFILPNAPDQPVQWAGGRRVSAWYDLRDTDFSRNEDESGLRRASAYCQALIHALIAEGADSRRIFIGGFSQGCALSLMAGVRFPHPLGGIFGLSGYLPLAARTQEEAHDANRHTPIFLAHGQYDRTISPTLAERARNCLLEQGHPVDWRTYPTEHTIILPELDDLVSWLECHSRDPAPAQPHLLPPRARPHAGRRGLPKGSR